MRIVIFFSTFSWNCARWCFGLISEFICSFLEFSWKNYDSGSSYQRDYNWFTILRLYKYNTLFQWKQVSQSVLISIKGRQDLWRGFMRLHLILQDTSGVGFSEFNLLCASAFRRQICVLFQLPNVYSERKLVGEWKTVLWVFHNWYVIFLGLFLIQVDLVGRCFFT